jgi:uncharacterized protein
MSRPPSAPTDVDVDADVCARANRRISRQFPAHELPRLVAAGLPAQEIVQAEFGFSLFDGQPAIDGAVHGKVDLVCQRCMKAVTIEVEEPFKVLVVREERLDEPGGYEPVVADPARLDLGWLVEEQLLLALPLVPMHEPGRCGAAAPLEAGESDESAQRDSRQKPFQNLRDMLRQQ